MFFIGVFGIENKSKEIKLLNNLRCKSCNNTVSGKLIKSYDYFHFFFIPIFKWNERYFVICDNCKTIFSILKEKGKAIERGEPLNITYWDLEEMPRGNYSNEIICRNCGKKVEANYKFCPYCGNKM